VSNSDGASIIALKLYFATYFLSVVSQVYVLKDSIKFFPKTLYAVQACIFRALTV